MLFIPNNMFQSFSACAVACLVPLLHETWPLSRVFPGLEDALDKQIAGFHLFPYYAHI